MDYYTQSLQALTTYLTPEKISRAMEAYTNKKEYKDKGNRAKTHWYHESYPFITASFNSTRGSAQKGRWIARLALVSSWVPTVPTPALEAEAMVELTDLEMKYYDRKLEEVDVAGLEEEIYFEIQENPVLLKAFLQLADRIANGGGNWDKSLSTTTKLLHFMCPALFPMFDGNTNQMIFGNKYFTYQKYHSYVFGLREFLQTTANREQLQELAQKEQVSLIRIVDILLFHMEEV